MIRESRRLAPLAENTAEMLAWRSVANCHQRHNVCGHFFDERSKGTGICNHLAAPSSATTNKLCQHCCASRR